MSKAIIRKSFIDGVAVYKVIANRQVEYSSEDAGCAEKFCENYFGTDWGWE